MDFTTLKVLPIHKYPEYLKQCCHLINEEWPRSETARMITLESSCDSLPTSLILVAENKKVIGHCKLTPLPSLPESCFIESVVISKELRGKKLGTFLMEKAEYYCKHNLHLKTVHLSTMGQKEFYSKLGYEVCAPVSKYGSSFTSIFKSTSCKPNVPQEIDNNKFNNSTNSSDKQIPPPPPMPKENIQISNNNIKNSHRTFMFKYL